MVVINDKSSVFAIHLVFLCKIDCYLLFFHGYVTFFTCESNNYMSNIACSEAQHCMCRLCMFGQPWWCLAQPNIYFVNVTLLSQMKEVKLVTNKLF